MATKLISVRLLISSQLVLAAGATAQVASVPPTSDVAAQPQLEEVVVTARRTEERLQDTPVAVSAVTADTLSKLNITQVSQVSQIVPNLVLTQGATGPTNTNVFIRGIGNSETLLTVDSPVGVYLDGVYLGRNNSLNADLVDLARVEVLRGPQGTLFGRNTSAGAVSLVSRQPDDQLTVRAASGWGREEGWYAKATLDTGELGQSGIKAILSYRHSDRDGFVDNPATDDRHDPGARRSDAIYAKIAAKLGALGVEYAFDYNDVHGQNEGYQLVAMGANQQAYFGRSASFGGAPLVLTKDRLSTLPLFSLKPLPDEQSSVIQGHSLTLTLPVSDAVTLKSITGYRRWHAVQPTEYGPDYKGPVNTAGVISIQDVNPFSGIVYNHQHQTSEEVQMLVKTERWSSVAGLFYFDEAVRVDNPTYFTFITPSAVNPLYPLVGLNLSSEARYSGNSKSYAAFGQTTYHPPVLDDQLALTAGLRYTRDERSIDIYNVGAAARSGDRNFHNLSYNLSADYHWAPNVMTFVRVATGYRAGGFNARQNVATASLDFNPEKATTYEAGFKADLLERRLRVNGTLFHTDYKDFQVTQFTGGTGTTTNANANYDGGELELQALFGRSFQVDASLGYVDPKYSYYPYSNPTTNVLQNYADIAHFPYVAKLTTHVGATYTFEQTSIGVPSFRVDFSSMSKRWFHGTNLPNANPFNDQITDPGRQLLSARLILAEIPLGGATAELQVYGSNLLNDKLVDSGIDFGSLGFAGVSYGPPRSFGVDAKIRF